MENLIFRNETQQRRSFFSQKAYLILLGFILTCTCLKLNAQGNDSSQWGEKYTRNMVSHETGLPDSFNLETGRNIKWIANTGSHGYSSPIIANGKVLIGANNAAQYDSAHAGDRGTLLCFNEEDGSLEWQLVVPRIEGDRHNDWPMIGICSSPTVEGDRAYILTNRSEVLCLDLNGQKDGNDGPFLGEGWYMTPSGELPYKVSLTDADIIWCYNLRLELGIAPHDSPHASILLDGDYIYLNTCNGVSYKHKATTAPTAPSLIALDKHTGRLVARDGENFGSRIFHSSWSSPALYENNGEKQIIFAGPDALMYGFEALSQSEKYDETQTLKKIWSFDCDPNAPKENIHDYMKNREVGPSVIMGMPVVYKKRVYITVGGDFYWGKREVWFKCIDATKTGDITKTGEIWSISLDQHSIATPAISKGLVYVTDFGKNLHCVDAENGEIYWKHQLNDAVWSSAFIADKKIYVASRGGDFWILEEGKKLNVLFSAKFVGPINSTTAAANGVLYVSTMNKLYAIAKQ